MKKKYTILIVDDDADDREIIRDAFESIDGHNEYIFIENGEKLMDYLTITPMKIIYHRLFC